MTERYLDYIRAINKAKASKCAYCKNKSVDIIAEGAFIKYVCSDHFSIPVPKDIPRHRNAIN